MGISMRAWLPSRLCCDILSLNVDNHDACRVLVPRQRRFFADLAVINDCLDELIALAKDTRQANDIEALQARDYSKVRLPDDTQFSAALDHGVAKVCQTLTCCVDSVPIPRELTRQWLRGHGRLAKHSPLQDPDPDPDLHPYPHLNPNLDPNHHP